MRALGKVKFSNDEASVTRCEDLDPFAPIEYNGKSMTWQ